MGVTKHLMCHIKFSIRVVIPNAVELLAIEVDGAFESVCGLGPGLHMLVLLVSLLALSLLHLTMRPIAAGQRSVLPQL